MPCTLKLWHLLPLLLLLLFTLVYAAKKGRNEDNAEEDGTEVSSFTDKDFWMASVLLALPPLSHLLPRSGWKS